MGKLLDVFGRKKSASIAKFGTRRLPTDIGVQPASADTKDPQNTTDDLDVDSYSKFSARLGEENEVLRKLLAEAERKFSELDGIKDAFAGIVDPARRALRTLAQEATRNLGLTHSLSQIRAGHGTLQSKFSDLEKKAVALASDNEKVRHELEATRKAARELKDSKTELDTALTAARARVLHVEARLAEVESGRNKRIAELTQSNEQHRTEYNHIQVQFEAVQARTVMAEKLLANTRQLMATWTEEARLAERRATEAMHARNAVEKKVAELMAWGKMQTARINELEQSVATMNERAVTLDSSLKSREAQLAEAEKKNQAATARMALLETDMKIRQMTADRRFDELTSKFENERLEHGVAEGALKAAREERAHLQQEVSQLQTALRRGKPTDECAEPELAPKKEFPDKGANAA
jgi:chromosome segregation ATPase